MKYLTLAFLFISFSASAQYATPEVLSTAGGGAIVGEVDLTWTFGEAVILTMEGSSNTLTNGFHQTDTFCFGDFNFDGMITTGDLLIFLAYFGCDGSCVTDLDENGIVNSADLLIFIGVYGTSCYGTLYE